MDGFRCSVAKAFLDSQLLPGDGISCTYHMALSFPLASLYIRSNVGERISRAFCPFISSDNIPKLSQLRRCSEHSIWTFLACCNLFADATINVTFPRLVFRVELIILCTVLGTNTCSRFGPGHPERLSKEQSQTVGLKTSSLWVAATDALMSCHPPSNRQELKNAEFLITLKVSLSCSSCMQLRLKI